MAAELGDAVKQWKILGALWLPYLVAFIISGIVTYLALHLLFKLLDKKKLNVFSLYCLVVGILAVLFL